MIQAFKIKELIDSDKLTFVDAYKAKLPDELTSVDKATRNKLKDEFISGKRELIITLPFSTSDRVINRRIYPQKGQKAGVKTWTEPFKRPVQIHHNDYQDPIGRVQKVFWKARDYRNDFKDLKSYNDFKSKIESNDALQIYSALLDYKKLGDPKWYGTGFLMGDISITSQDAIEKFIDERYLTFSSGHVSDAWICSHCGADWMKGDSCGHYPGQVVDNKPVVAVLGTFIGREISAVNKPANDTSFPVNMRFADSVDTNIIGSADDFTNNIIDYEEESLMKLKVIKDEEDIQTIEFPEDYLTKDSVKALLDETLATLDTKIVALLDTKFNELKDSLPEKVEQDEEIEEEFVDDETIDWAILELALDAEVISDNADAKLSTEKRKELPSTSFCGPNRSFPVPDCAHVTAARRLVGRAKLSEDQKKRVLACVNRKAKNMSCDNEELTKLSSDLSDMTQNYQTALSEIENLKEELKNVKQILDSAKESKENVNKEEISSVKDPQTAGAVSDTEDSDKNKTKKDPFIQRIIDSYKAKAEKNQNEADEYIASMKARKYLNPKFDIKDYLK